MNLSISKFRTVVLGDARKTDFKVEFFFFNYLTRVDLTFFLLVKPRRQENRL